MQVMRQLQELAAAMELRFEVARDTALCFQVCCTLSRRPNLQMFAFCQLLSERMCSVYSAQLFV